MGCDIHPWIQWLEYPKTGKHEDMWSEWSGEMNWGRSYELFSRMAGVRCYCEGRSYPHACPKAIVQPRGWPDRKPWSAQAEEFHTPSWLTLEEFKRAAEGNDWPEIKATIAAMETLEATGHKTRLVFAFDN